MKRIPVYQMKPTQVGVTLVDDEAVRLIRGRKLFLSTTGYVLMDKKRLHRVITNCPPTRIVDHLNHNPLDNRRSNLRVTTHSGNGLNRSGPQPNSTTGIRGVYKWKSSKTTPWIAKVVIRGKQHIRYCRTKKEAAQEVKLLHQELLGSV